MLDQGAILTAAGILIGFSVDAVLWRIRRELEIQKAGEITWIPWCDCLPISALILLNFLVIIPTVTGFYGVPSWRAISGASCAAAAILLTFYPFAILAHYRITIGQDQTGPRRRGEPKE